MCYFEVQYVSTRTIRRKHHMHSRLLEDRIRKMEWQNQRQHQQSLTVSGVVHMRGFCFRRNDPRNWMNTHDNSVEDSRLV